jgi:hypothetical protein
MGQRMKKGTDLEAADGEIASLAPGTRAPASLEAIAGIWTDLIANSLL